MQIWIPMNGRRLTEPSIEWIRISEHLRIQQLIEAKSWGGSVCRD
jgi:hypothetical protein